MALRKENHMNNVAFLTYNTVGGGLRNGWHDGPDGRRAFVLQNDSGNRWAVEDLFQDPTTIPEGYSRGSKTNVDHVRGKIDGLWGQLQEVLADLDHVVVYVGASGSERAIVLAAQLPASKVTFVGCDCNLPVKELLIQSAGLAEAERMLCECGGRQTMRKLFSNFLASGELRPRASVTDMAL